MPSPAAVCKLLVMGVSGCGKSTLAARLAQDRGALMIEGDDFHPPANVARMQQGIALDDTDRLPWLDVLGAHLAREAGPAVLTCSALKRVYRARLRAHVPDLRIVFMDIDLAEATQRLHARTHHFFHPRLVSSQFLALESPVGEPGVLRVSSLLALPQQAAVVARWLSSVLPASEAASIPFNVSTS